MRTAGIYTRRRWRYTDRSAYETPTMLISQSILILLLFLSKYRNSCIYYVIRFNYSAGITQIETVWQLCGPRKYIRDADGVMRTGLL